MKGIVLTFTLIIAGLSIFSQTTDTLPLPESTIEEAEDPSQDRIIMNVHWDGWLGAPDSFKVKPLSSGLGFHIYYDIPFGTSRADKPQASFAIGAGMSWSNYYNNSYFVYDTAENTIPIKFDTVQYNKNKFVINYVEVPLEFRFRTKENGTGNRFKAAIGFKAGYVITNHTKFVGEDYRPNGGNDEIKYKEYRVKNLSNLQFGPTLRLGYSKINLEAYYGLAPIFIDGKGPSGNPLTIGVSFNPF